MAPCRRGKGTRHPTAAATTKPQTHKCYYCNVACSIVEYFAGGIARLTSTSLNSFCCRPISAACLSTTHARHGAQTSSPAHVRFSAELRRRNRVNINTKGRVCRRSWSSAQQLNTQPPMLTICRRSSMLPLRVTKQLSHCVFSTIIIIRATFARV